MHCPLFVELCAGTAALSLRLHKDGAKPPVSRMGAKTGYADRILTLLGLVPGQGADAYLWCEPDPGVRLLLEAYRDAGLAREAAAIIRSWAAEDPRQLWERLRAEGPPKLPEVGEVTACAVARWAFVQRVTGRGVQWGATLDLNGSGGGDPRTGQRFPFSLAKNTIPIDAYEVSPATITSDACEVDPREVARWAFVQSCNTMIALDSNWRNTGAGGSTFHGGDRAGDPFRAAGALAQTSVPPALIHPDARLVDPPALPPGTVVYLDPPYVGTTGYTHDLGRAEVVCIALRWAAAGAVVAISEAEPISELVTEGWFAVEITGQRFGAARTFSKQKREFLTMNREPVEAVGPVFDLFG